jgi:hypothetical protein
MKKSLRQQLRELAERTAFDLFTNGAGQTADRLGLEADGKDIGGWCPAAVRDRLLPAMERAVELAWWAERDQ